MLTSRKRTIFITVALFTTTLLAYLPVWHAQFLNVDDPSYVTGNAIVQQGLTRNGIAWAFSAPHVANYHPLTWLSHMLDCMLFGLNPAGPHAVNLFIHAVNVLLLFFVLRQMTGREWPSAFVAAIFALHPEHVESVAWIAERKDVLSGFFFLLTLAAYAHYVRRPGVIRYAMVAIAFVLGLLAKPMVVTLPCVLLLLDVWPLYRTRWIKPPDGEHVDESRIRSTVALVVEKIPLLALSVASCVITYFAQADYGAVVTTNSAPISYRIGNTLVSYARYAQKFVFPIHLAAFYPLMRPWPLIGVLAAGTLLIAITIATLYFSRRSPYLPVGWFWFIGMLVPVIGLVEVGNQAMADRYMYLPMIGLAIIAAWLGADLLPYVGRRGLVIATSIVLAAFAILTINETGYWHDTATLYTRSIANTEPNVFALNTLSANLISRGKIDEAIADLKQCVAIQPQNSHVRRSLGYALGSAGRYDEAFKEFTIAVRLDPDDYRTWNNMGHVDIEQKDWPSAANHFEMAVRLRPDDYDSLINLAVAHREVNKPAAALDDVRAALRIYTHFEQPWYMEGLLLLEAGQNAQAVAPLQRAVAIAPSHADAQCHLGQALMLSGQGDRAIKPLMAAVRLSPNSTEALSRLAWILATYPDARLRSIDDARYLASRASELSGSTSAQALDALAASFADQGKFDQAIATAVKAADRAAADHNAPVARAIEGHLNSYRAHQPFRDESLAGADVSPITE